MGSANPLPENMGGGRDLVRAIESNDLDGLLAMCAEHAKFEGSTFDPDGVADRLRRALWDQPARLSVWVAVDRDAFIGYASAVAEFSTWSAREYLHMDCLFVREAWRGTGVGSALLVTVTAHARSGGFAELQWQTPVWNEAAARFYRRHGASEQSKRRFFLCL